MSRRLPPIGTLGFRVQRYGMLQWGDLFTARQKVTLHVLANQTAVMQGAGTNASVLTIGKLLDLAKRTVRVDARTRMPVGRF